jgi:two-component system, response regulator PdtaR
MTPVKILLVEDQFMIAQDIENLLTDWGYDFVGCAASGKEALSLFDIHKPDLALVDIHIDGDMDGIDTVKIMHSIRPMPIVYLTAQADRQTIERAKASSPFAYLLKPFDERNLQISLELAFDIFDKHKSTFSKQEFIVPPPANEVKLSADMILQNDDCIFIKQNYRFVKINKDDLVMIESDRNYAFIHTTQHKYIVRMPLASILERLQLDNLVRIHRSFVINVKHVEEFNESEIRINGKTIAFSQAYRDAFLKHFSVI